jgi:hypothetical protein
MFIPIKFERKVQQVWEKEKEKERERDYLGYKQRERFRAARSHEVL